MPADEKRTDPYCVRLNRKERRLLLWLSGRLALVRLADVFREGLLALQAREAEAPEPPSLAPGRPARAPPPDPKAPR